MLSPDIAFQNCANTAAAANARLPPFITYDVSTHVTAPSLGRDRTISRSVDVRTRDDLAVLHDLPGGATSIARGFPVTPGFDALSYFTLSWSVGRRMDVSASVHDVKPLTYAAPDKTAADVVVVRLRQYRVAYAADSSGEPGRRTHITLEPYDFVRHAVVKPDSTFFLSDLVIDNGTGLPVEVGYSGGDDIRFTVEYGTYQNTWLVDKVHYEETVHGPLRIGRVHFVADATYSNFTFPASAPEAALAN